MCAGGKQLSQAAGGDGGSGLGVGGQIGGPSCPQSSCLLLVFPPDPWNNQLLRDRQAVGRCDRSQHCVDWVRRGSRVTERVAVGLGVRVHCRSVGMSLVHGALSSHGGGCVSDNGRGHARRCVQPELVTWQWVKERNACRDRLLCVTGVCCRRRCIMVQLMSVWHGSGDHAGRMVLATVLARPGLLWARAGCRGLG